MVTMEHRREDIELTWKSALHRRRGWYWVLRKRWGVQSVKEREWEAEGEQGWKEYNFLKPQRPGQWDGNVGDVMQWQRVMEKSWG